MKHLFVSYEISMLAKNNGFVENCLAFYFNEECLELIYSPFEHPCSNPEFNMESHSCATPLFQQLVDWFREKHQIYVEVHGYYKLLKGHVGYDNKHSYEWVSSTEITNYYLALNEAIETAFILLP